MKAYLEYDFLGSYDRTSLRMRQFYAEYKNLVDPENHYVAARLGEAMRTAMGSAEVRRTFETAGSPPAYQDEAEFARFVEADSARLIAAVRKIGKVE